jgi:hypothetical protein
MNLLTALNYQSYASSQGWRTQSDVDFSTTKPAILASADNAASSIRASQDQSKNLQVENTLDKVDISAQGKKASQEEDPLLMLSEDEKKQVETLKVRDREVRVHEQAHAAVGGQYAGSPSYEYETGPDNKRYAVSGEVSIDVSEEEKPKDTIQKMQVVRAAALAPAQPSTQDLKVAAEATQKERQARAEFAQEQISDVRQVADYSNNRAKAYEQANTNAIKSFFFEQA